ncbi:MAG: hypothetical protein IJ217_00975 [Clostridia bacterium]|nr:hypothetical protein [Clostridia bacterium]
MKYKKLVLCLLFWWALMFPQFNLLPENIDSSDNIEIHFWLYDTFAK